MSLLFSALHVAHAAPEAPKFYYDGAKDSTPLTIELKSVEYRAKGMELEFVVNNNSNTGVDFTKALWNINSGGRSGYISYSDFDGMVVHPKSKRVAKINFEFDSVATPSFLKERYHGTSVIKLDNVTTFQNRKLPTITLQNY